MTRDARRISVAARYGFRRFSECQLARVSLIPERVTRDHGGLSRTASASLAATDQLRRFVCQEASCSDSLVAHPNRAGSVRLAGSVGRTVPRAMSPGFIQRCSGAAGIERAAVPRSRLSVSEGRESAAEVSEIPGRWSASRRRCCRVETRPGLLASAARRVLQSARRPLLRQKDGSGWPPRRISANELHRWRSEPVLPRPAAWLASGTPVGVTVLSAVWLCRVHSSVPLVAHLPP